MVEKENALLQSELRRIRRQIDPLESQMDLTKVSIVCQDVLSFAELIGNFFGFKAGRFSFREF